jgi:hypothetical protein
VTEDGAKLRRLRTAQRRIAFEPALRGAAGFVEHAAVTDEIGDAKVWQSSAQIEIFDTRFELRPNWI